MSRSRCFIGVFALDNLENVLELLRNHFDWFVGRRQRNAVGEGTVKVVFRGKMQKHLARVIAIFPLSSKINICNLPFVEIMEVTNSKDGVGEIIEEGERPDYKRPSYNSLLKTARQRYDNDKNIQTFLERQNPAQFIVREEEYVRPDKSNYRLSDFSVYPIPAKILKNRVQVLVGPKGFGKTQFALAHGEHPVIIKQKKDWKKIRYGVTDLVLVDIPTVNWRPLELKKFLIIDRNVTFDVKYSSVTLESGIPRFICCNSEDLLWPKGIDPDTKEACIRRCNIHLLTEPLFDQSNNESFDNFTLTKRVSPSSSMTPYHSESNDDANIELYNPAVEPVAGPSGVFREITIKERDSDHEEISNTIEEIDHKSFKEEPRLINFEMASEFGEKRKRKVTEKKVGKKSKK